MGLLLLLSACTTFDKTNILPAQRVEGLGFSFAVPTEKAWFAVVYGNSHRIKLRQLNDSDSYAITIALNKGPRSGMYTSAQAHLAALERHLHSQGIPRGLVRHRQNIGIDTRYGDLCVRHSSLEEDWRGRNNAGPAMVENITLICSHPAFNNVLISSEFSRRYEIDAEEVDLNNYADQLFASIEFEHSE